MTRAVLAFHGVDDSGSALSYSPRAFAVLIEHLLRSAIPIVTFDRLRTVSMGVTLTFDDALESVRRNALPVLRESNSPAHLFVVAGRVGLDDRWDGHASRDPPARIMDWDAIEACAAAGMTVESHTASHPDLRGLGRERVLEEFASADEAIARHVGRRPRLLAYPYGAVDATVRGAAQERYEAAFTTRPGYVDAASDPHQVPRIGSHYLQPPCPTRRLLQRPGRAYIAARRVLRELRERA